jgi:hypothetical protein
VGLKSVGQVMSLQIGDIGPDGLKQGWETFLVKGPILIFERRATQKIIYKDVN